MAPRLAPRSQQLYKRARDLIPGGVNSPVRAYPPFPLFVSSAKGSRFRTVDGDDYLDYCMAYGALLDGHGYPDVIERVKIAIDGGTIFGQPTEMEVELAGLISTLVPSMEMVRLVNSGTEATMHALRLARGFTGRRRILKFEGGFHGSHDDVLVKAGSGATIQGTPSSEGVLRESARNTLVARYNDEKTVKKILKDYSEELAAVIVEPVMGNMGPITPSPGFLETLREATEENGSLLVFDEVITGFRLGLGGAQEYYRVYPDLTVLGKVLGGGFPLSAFGGRRDIMEKIAPLGPVYQAGTYSGNPVSVAAGISTLQSLKKRADQVYPRLEQMGSKLREGMRHALDSLNASAQVNGIGSMFQVFFTKRLVSDYQSAKSSDTERYQRYFRSLLASHIFVPPSQFETCFLSTAHTHDQIDSTVDSVKKALKAVFR